MKRFSTDYPGIFYRIGERIGGKGEERIYYILFKKNGKILEEKVGRQYADDMTPARAARIRADRIEGRRASRKELREAKKAAEGKVTMNRIWELYNAQRRACRGRENDRGLYHNYLKMPLGEKEPHKIARLDTDRLRINLSKKLKPQTVKHVLELLKRLVNFGVSSQISKPLPFKVVLPAVDNAKTENLSAEQLRNLLKAVDKSADIEAANIMLMALFTGMRRGELFKLKWTDVDFDKGFILIRAPKGGKSQTIPLNDRARDVLNNHPRTSEYVFVTHAGRPFVDIGRRVNIIKRAAGIGPEFRALHGLRHVYASILASSGVDIYTLQRLLTHKSPIMTQRYAHLRDETLKKASTLAGNIIAQAAKAKDNRQNETARA